MLLGGAKARFASHTFSFMRVLVMHRGHPAWCEEDTSTWGIRDARGGGGGRIPGPVQRPPDGRTLLTPYGEMDKEGGRSGSQGGRWTRGADGNWEPYRAKHQKGELLALPCLFQPDHDPHLSFRPCLEWCSRRAPGGSEPSPFPILGCVASLLLASCYLVVHPLVRSPVYQWGWRTVGDGRDLFAGCRDCHVCAWARLLHMLVGGRAVL